MPQKILKAAMLLVIACFVFTGCSSQMPSAAEKTGQEEKNQIDKPGDGTLVRIGSQGYAEVEILAEMVKAIIEEETNHPVEHVKNLGGEFLTQKATVQGDLDFFLTFTGTQFLGTFQQKATPEWRDPDKVWQYVHDHMMSDFGLYTFPAFGYNNIWAMAVKRDTAEKNHLKKISDLEPYAGNMQLGTDPTFPDYPGQGYKELCATYGFKFKKVVPMDLGLLYRALKNAEVDAAVVYSTDGRNRAMDFVLLEDDKAFNPPYYSITATRRDFLDKHPEIEEAVKKLGGIITDEDMIALNAKVDVEHQDAAAVAREFLKAKGLVK
ncbi:MAG: osmoprotectant ABC transporter substrate-binding protein [Firmicutes bacterium]|nr:osmoprotectant ABC transporter substrate-binding protein [Bacillota bacterium]